MANTSDGPDQFKGHIKCKEFHTDDPPARSGHPDFCCCCNPCLYDRPGLPNEETSFNHCCRCMPRVLFLEFTADYGDPCSVDSVIPMFLQWPQAIYEDQETNSYTATLYGVDVILTVGDTDFGGYSCEWRLQIPEWYVDESIEIDHVDVTCLEPPAFTIENAVGAGGGSGTITFGTYDMVKVPFQLRDQPETLFHDIECGECTQVCHTLCVIGRRYDGGGVERVEFVWDESAEIPTWTYTRPDDTVEIITLEEGDYGVCELHTDFDEYEKNLDPIELTDCSCELDVSNSFSWGSEIENKVRFRIRCGMCSCWEYLCGDCRCVPKSICVYGIENGDFFGPKGLTWDGTSWTDGIHGVAPGKDEFGNCILGGGEFGESAFECGDIISFSMSSTDEYGNNFFMAGGSLRSCDLSDCQDATPCAANCGSHPETLTAHLRAWNDPYLDEPDVGDDCFEEVTLHYIEEFFDVSLVPPERTCKYVGFKEIECPHFTGETITHLIRFELTNGVFSVISGGSEVEYILEYENCDPYEASYPETATEIVGCSWGCSDIQREEIIITE